MHYVWQSKWEGGGGDKKHIWNSEKWSRYFKSLMPHTNRWDMKKINKKKQKTLKWNTANRDTMKWGLSVSEIATAVALG